MDVAVGDSGAVPPGGGGAVEAAEGRAGRAGEGVGGAAGAGMVGARAREVEHRSGAVQNACNGSGFPRLQRALNGIGCQLASRVGRVRL